MKRNSFLLLALCIINAAYAQGVDESECEVILKPSQVSGVGIFAVHDIPAGSEIFTAEMIVREISVSNVPKEFLDYCIYLDNETCRAPDRFDRIDSIWFVNHSFDPNVTSEALRKHEQIESSNRYIIIGSLKAIKDIKAGEEILVNYNDLNEPAQFVEDYYKTQSK